MCSRYGMPCGTLTGPDCCGHTQVVNCGTCTQNQVDTFSWPPLPPGSGIHCWGGYIYRSTPTLQAYFEQDMYLTKVGATFELSGHTTDVFPDPLFNNCQGNVNGPSFSCYNYPLTNVMTVSNGTVTVAVDGSRSTGTINTIVTRCGGSSAYPQPPPVTPVVDAGNWGDGGIDCLPRVTGSGTGTHSPSWPWSPDFSAPVRSVWASSSSDVWAVGEYELLKHWNGTAWSTDRTGLPAFVPGQNYAQVWGCRSNDVWAVGQGGIDRWTGASWTRVQNPSTITQVAVWGSNSNDVWVVGGYYPNGTGAPHGFMVNHWNGSSWTPTGTSTGGALIAINGSSASDVWAVGEGGLMIHWNGSAWASVPSGTTQDLKAVWALSATDAWVGGAATTLLHWDGTTWTPVSAPSGGVVGVTGLWGSASNNVYAVGEFVGGILHWNGTSWSVFPHGGAANFTAVWGVATDDIRAGGYSTANRLGVVANGY